MAPTSPPPTATRASRYYYSTGRHHIRCALQPLDQEVGIVRSTAPGGVSAHAAVSTQYPLTLYFARGPLVDNNAALSSFAEFVLHPGQHGVYTVSFADPRTMPLFVLSSACHRRHVQRNPAALCR